MQMYDKAEADYTELSSKKRIVEADRKKIEKVLPVSAPALYTASKDMLWLACNSTSM